MILSQRTAQQVAADLLDGDRAKRLLAVKSAQHNALGLQKINLLSQISNQDSIISKLTERIQIKDDKITAEQELREFWKDEAKRQKRLKWVAIIICAVFGFLAIAH